MKSENIDMHLFQLDETYVHVQYAVLTFRGIQTMARVSHGSTPIQRNNTRVGSPAAGPLASTRPYNVHAIHTCMIGIPCTRPR